VDLPGEVAGCVAINEVVVHGWDIAAATGHDYACETELVQAAYAFAAAIPPGSQLAGTNLRSCQTNPGDAVR